MSADLTTPEETERTADREGRGGSVAAASGAGAPAGAGDAGHGGSAAAASGVGDVGGAGHGGSKAAASGAGGVGGPGHGGSKAAASGAGGVGGAGHGGSKAAASGAGGVGGAGEPGGAGHGASAATANGAGDQGGAEHGGSASGPGHDGSAGGPGHGESASGAGGTGYAGSEAAASGPGGAGHAGSKAAASGAGEPGAIETRARGEHVGSAAAASGAGYPEASETRARGGGAGGGGGPQAVEVSAPVARLTAGRGRYGGGARAADRAGGGTATPAGGGGGPGAGGRLAPPPVRRARRAPVPGAAPRAVDRRDRIEGLLLGLAAGDAAGWPAARHRAARMPEWTRRLTRELDTFAEENATTTLPVPIALNQPPEPLRLGPSDDAEWAVFTAEAVLAAAGPGPLFRALAPERRLRAAVDLAWNSLASQVGAASDRAPEVESAVLPLRARISVRAGLGNLAAGLRPPATGHDNPHYFDDAACVRAAVLALVHPGDPVAAAGLAEFDARFTQDGDGVHGARAMAAATAAAIGGAGPGEAVEAALGQLPPATEIGRNGRHAVKLARTAATAFELVPLLEHQIVDHVYSYGIAAAETVPVALALTLAARGDLAAAVPAAACLSRVADSAPALAGALTGALGGGAAVPATWREACRTLAGCALPRLAGTDLVELAGLLAATEPAAPGGQFRHDTPHAPAG